VFANSVVLFRSLPDNQQRSKFTEFCNKHASMKLFKTCDINIVNLLFSVCFAAGYIHSGEIKIFKNLSIVILF